MTLVERLLNLVEVSEVECERNLYIECADSIEALEHDITRQMNIATEYLNRCEALEKALREIMEESDGFAHHRARAALEEGE